MKNLPYEVVDKIFDYYDDLHAIDTHKNIYRQVMDKIAIQSVLIQHESIMSTYLVGWDSNLYNIDDYERMLDICNTCKCCIRHQTYRPNINNVHDGSYFKTKYDRNTRKGNRNYKYGCKCGCRTISRMICSLIECKLHRNDNLDNLDNIDNLYEEEEDFLERWADV